MDFLKACTTNVHAIDSLSDIRYCRYDHTGPSLTDVEHWIRLQDALVSLRQQNVLCSSAHGDLWLFGAIDEAQDHVLELFNAIEEGRLEDPPHQQTSNGALIRDIFLDAIEGGLAFSLARDGSTIHIAPWTWLYVDIEEEHAEYNSSLMRLHTKFPLSGGLYLLPEIKQTPLRPLPPHPQPSHQLLMAPSGGLVTSLAADASSTFADASWKESVTRALTTEGIRIPSDSPWVLVQAVHNMGSSFLWPALLLIARSGTADSNITSFKELVDWRSWFVGSEDVPAFRNPLFVAEEWFQGSLDRQRATQAVSAARTTPAKDGSAFTVANLEHPAHGDVDVVSPLSTQRTLDPQATMAGVYPTPPDGLTHGQQSLGSIPASTPSVSQGDPTYSIIEQIPTSDHSQSKVERFPTDLSEAGFQMEQDELFDDSGEMEFGENEVGDADFSFFDEPDDVINETMVPQNDTQAMPDDAEPMQLGGTSEFETGEYRPSKEDVEGPPNSASEPPASANASPVSDSQRLSLEDATANGGSAPKFGGTVVPLEKPLSPFGIRERLLPPPVPASIAQSDTRDTAVHRRASAFSPIVFRENLSLGPRYEVPDLTRAENQARAGKLTVPSISLPPIRKKSRLLKPRVERDDGDSESESEEDSFESCSSDTDDDTPLRLPWDNKKRKRNVDLTANVDDNTLVPHWADEHEQVVQHSNQQILDFLRQQFEPSRDVEKFLAPHKINTGTQKVVEQPPQLEEFCDLPKEDLIYVAQIVGEQSVTALDCTESSNFPTAASQSQWPSTGNSAWRKGIFRALESVLSDCELCDLSRITLTRDPHPQPRALTNSSRPSQGQPRPPPQRTDSTTPGPDYFQLPPPYVKIQRGADNWEMLSTCLSFWEPLGLGPANGPKDVRAFCVFPGNKHLQLLLEKFIVELGTAYEGCKLGSHAHVRNADPDIELDDYQNGMAPIELGTGSSLESALKAYASTCIDLGKSLSSITSNEGDRTIVIYMLNPFPGRQASQLLCACFWLLFKAYRDNLPKTHRSQCGSDIVLQLLPIDLVANFDMLVILDSKQMAVLAREVYDRCPPSSAMQAAEHTSALPILAAPSVELASAAPKRIGFQLAAEPPSDLLHEGSILHIAYSCTSDRQWLAATWLDNTGQYYSTASFSLRGRSFAAGAGLVWERTYEILAARQVTWRIFIVTSDPVDRSISQCWRSLSSNPRKQPLCVTLLSVQTDLKLQLSPLDTQAGWSNGLDQGFLTPASTPQASTLASSPDVSSHANAPLTPAPSETAALLAENDPDAHLIDMTEESWGVMLSPKVTNLACCVGLANAALFKRGNADPLAEQALPSLGVSLHWTIQVKPNASVDEGSVKQSELTLREVLRMYRNLSLLSKQRGLLDERVRVAPLHVAAAIRGADYLDGMLAPV